MILTIIIIMTLTKFENLLILTVMKSERNMFLNQYIIKVPQCGVKGI